MRFVWMGSYMTGTRDNSHATNHRGNAWMGSYMTGMEGNNPTTNYRENALLGMDGIIYDRY